MFPLAICELLYILAFLNFSYSSRYGVVYCCSFNLHFPDDNDIGYLCSYSSMARSRVFILSLCKVLHP